VGIVCAIQGAGVGEARELVESGLDYVTEMNSMILFRKREQFVVD
jgi:hypothetical protein